MRVYYPPMPGQSEVKSIFQKSVDRQSAVAGGPEFDAIRCQFNQQRQFQSFYAGEWAVGN